MHHLSGPVYFKQDEGATEGTLGDQAYKAHVCGVLPERFALIKKAISSICIITLIEMQRSPLHWFSSFIPV